MFFQKIRKLTISLLLSVFVFSSLIGFLISAQPAAAIPTEVLADVPAQTNTIFNMIKNGWKIAVLNAAQQAVSYFLRKVAYDSAVWLASGGKGQGTLAHSKGFGSYMASVGSEAAGTAIEQLGKGFGLDLCKIPDVKIDLAFRIGLHYNFNLGAGQGGPTKPACNLETFQKNWGGDAWASKYGDGKGGFDVNKVFNSSLTVADAPLGIAMKTTEKIDRLVMKQTSAASADRIEGAGFKAITKLISGDVKTPSQVIAQESKANAPSEQNKKSEAQIASAMGSGAYEILPSTLGLFLNTLSGQMLKNFKENGMLPGGICVGSFGGPDCKNSGGQASSFDSEAGTGGRAAAEAAFSEFLTTKLDTLSNYDILADLNSCETRGLYNCRADQGIVQAIQEGKQENGTPVTIKEAIDKGWLHGNWKLIPPSRVADNADKNCFNSNYCYSNLQVLRQLRIIPLGLEIAAKNSDPDHPATLNDVVNGFYDCSYIKDKSGNVVGVNYDPENKPYCHLVDPNWILKLSQTRCDAMAYSATPLSTDVPDRIKECVDLKTCIGSDKDGNCSGYGNCVREKNVWRFDADQCDSQYATCRAFTDSAGKAVSYLYRTLDTGDCNQDTAGCTAYSLDQDNTGWKALATSSYGNYSTGIYLNKNVSTACSASAVGCSAFKLPDSNDRNSYIPIKKAPDYLNCYDTDALASNGIQWPKTFSDIFKMQPKAECKDFAQVCIADEVGCGNYKLADDPQSLVIPGKFISATIASNTIQNWNDQCDGKCAGYAAYREMPSNYASGTPLAYIIPPSKYNGGQSGKVCTAEQVSCSSFTNMSAGDAGGEKIEYFTDLRACIKPDANKQKNFYTYEGSVIGGYQLQSYTLQKDAVSGEPATVFITPQDKIDAGQFKCNATLYKAGQADPDCRQFNDDKGVISYALLMHTIAVSPDCTPFRLNSTELAGAGKCFSNGEYNANDGACYYNGLPTGVTAPGVGGSTVCSADVVSCREYKGNNGNNIKTVLVDNFESQNSASVTNGWASASAGTLSWSSESTKAGEHSIGFSGAINNTLQKTLVLSADSLDLQNNMSYSLSFWAKGSGVNVGISMTDGSGSQVSAGKITANTSWQYYKFNLVELLSSGTSTINFVLNGSGNLFVDNVRLTKVSEFLYLVKDSLKVDPICDDNPNDNLPGAALGCNAYTGPQNSLGTRDYFLTNFSFLCREGAIGCTAFVDTYNKLSDSGPRAYNVQLTGTPGSKVVTSFGDETSFTCQIEQDKNSCYTNVFGYTKNVIENNPIAHFVKSTYYLPADTSSTDPVYLVAKNDVVDFTCNAADLGCTTAGLQKSTPSGNQFETTTIKLDPSLLLPSTGDNPTPGILCHQEALGCGVYGSTLGDTYFKDPGITGSKICTYQTNVIKNNNKVNGWFWKDVGVCGSTSTPATYPLVSQTCSSDDNCSATTAFNTCIDIGAQPCYPDYIQNGNSFGLWSYGNKTKYDNFVGECPAEQNACTEFVDHNDNNTAYYFLKNAKVSEGDCGGVSQKAGCALFDQTDNPNKFWNTSATYLLSDNFAPGKNNDLSKVTKVQPVDKGATNDANIIIKVKRDRECAEWLQCSQSHTVWDENLSKPKNICDKFKRCDALFTNQQGKNDLGNCAEYVDGIHDVANQILTDEVYFDRDITWKGREFDGFSILGMYPLEELGQYNISTVGVEDFRLAKAIPCAGNNCQAVPINQYSCSSTNAIIPVPCGANNSGFCINKICIKDIDGTTEKLVAPSRAMICRAYPEKDSPFPNSTFTDKQTFVNVNKCQEFDQGKVKSTSDLAWANTWANKCECDYTKVTFGDGLFKKYWNDVKPNSGGSNQPQIGTVAGEVPTGICSGGLTDGIGCANDDECKMPVGGGAVDPGSSATCQLAKKISSYIGWRGYCLERDISRNINGRQDENACLTWFPVDSLAGTKDINNQFKTAGFVPPSNAKYCLASELYKKTQSYGPECRDPIGNLATEGDCTIQLCADSGYKSGANGWCGAGYVTTIGCGNVDDCHHSFGQNDCEITCKPNDPNQWVGAATFTSGINTVGCQAFALIDSSNSAPWTDRLWKDSKHPYAIVPANQADKDTLNYNFQTTSSPFAYISESTNALLNLQTCKSGLTLEKPFSNFSCNTSPAPFGIKKSDLGYTNLSYDGSWNYVVGSECTTNDSCNVGVTCTNNLASAECRRGCVSDSDCKVASSTYGDFGTCLNHVCTGKDTKNLTCVTNNNTCINANNNLKAQNSNATSSYNFCQGACILNNKATTNPTTPCESDIQCYTKKCIGTAPNQQCLDLNVPTSTIVAKDVKTKILDAWGQFKQIFAKLNSVMSFNDAAGSAGQKYEALDVTSTGPLASVVDYAASADPSTAPMVFPVGPCNSGGKCLQLHSGNFSINGISEKNVIIESQPADAMATFYAAADSNHMQIRKVLVDWGDGDTYYAPAGYYRNQLGPVNANECSAADPAAPTKKTCFSTGANYRWKQKECSTVDDCKYLDLCGSADDAPSYGYIKDLTCDSAFFSYSHPYICVKDSEDKAYVDDKLQKIWQADCDGNIDMQTAYGGCCVYQPKIQVVDNWGWCNGTCPGGQAGDGCYNGIPEECYLLYNTTANTSFLKKILVAPGKMSTTTQP